MTTYLCGGIAGLSDEQCNGWRTKAKSLLKTKTLDPMVRDCRGKEGKIDPNWLVKADIKDIYDSEFVLVNATKPSWGTAMEVVYAHEEGSVVVAFTGQTSVSPWLRYHCSSIVETVEEACEVINTWYGRMHGKL